jgi:ATP-dependent DNA ligase
MDAVLSPMLARLADVLPAGAGWLYEPKWDGFRARVEVGSGAAAIHSRNGHRLDGVFADVAAAAAAALPAGCAVDGELVSPVAGGGVGFEGLLHRLGHRAGHPAALVVFDLLSLDATGVIHLPLSERRRLLEGAIVPHPLVEPTAQTADLEEARCWLEDCDLPGLEGVVAKRAGDPYRPGSRGWVKVKRRRTVDCVVGGFRGARLLLGLYDGDGLLHHVGETVTLTPAVWAGATPILGREGRAFTGRPPGLGRWEASRYDEWTECVGAAVCEVSYTLLEAGRFRHPVRFVRWRPDRDPVSCRREQVLPADVRAGSTA